MDITEPTPEEGSRLPAKNGSADKSKIIDWFKSLLPKAEEHSLKSELEEIIQEHEEEGHAVAEDNTILRNVLKFGDIRVADVMTPRLDICAVQAEISLDDLKSFIDENEHTRIPVYDKNLDDVVGFIHIKDLITYWINAKQFKIHEILREVLFVPPSMKISNLLVKMQSERTHLAIVVDEYGGTTGLVTIEDLVEQIVGEIDDEHDESDEQEIVSLADGSYEVLARVDIDKIEANLGIKLQKEEEEHYFDTIGGFIFTSLGKIPRIGESVAHESGFDFKVIDADKRHIKKIKITRLATEASLTQVPQNS